MSGEDAAVALEDLISEEIEIVRACVQLAERLIDDLSAKPDRADRWQDAHDVMPLYCLLKRHDTVMHQILSEYNAESWRPAPGR
jgi:hypothetical protein